MDARVAAKLELAANDNGLDLRMYTDYSGRGMYGSSTAGIVGSLGEMLQCVATVAADLAHEEREIKGTSVLGGPEDVEDEDAMTVEEFISEIGGLRTDSMGRDTVYY